MWSERVANNLSAIRLLVVGCQVESVMDFMTEKYGGLDEFRMVVLPVEAALPPILLFLTNLICVNLAVMVTFVAQGIVPGRGDATRRASRTVTVAVLVWMAFLIAVVAAIISNQQAGFLSM